MKSETKSLAAIKRWRNPLYKQQMIDAHKGKNLKHGLSTRGEKSKFYKVWENINTRCRSVKYKGYKNYGGRGIKCEWIDFMDFKTDMYDLYLEHIKEYGERNTMIERIDNNGNYCKNNCRWATKKEQVHNMRTNFMVPLIEVEMGLGINHSTLRGNIAKFGVEEAFKKFLSSERQRLIDQILKEVIGEDEFEMSQTNGTGTYPDTKEHYANQLRAEQRQKIKEIKRLK